MCPATWTRRVVAAVAATCSVLVNVEGRGAQIRNIAGEAVDFYWMDVNNWGTYVKQNTKPLVNASTMPLKTYETHRFFAAWADETQLVPSWDPDQIPASLQFVHRGYDQVVTAKIDEDGGLYVEDWDVLEGEVAAVTKLVEECKSDDVDEYAECVVQRAGDRVQRLEDELKWVREHSVAIRERLDTSFCGNGQYHSQPLRTLTWGSGPEEHHVDVLLETPEVTIYHARHFLDGADAKAVINLKPTNETRYTEFDLRTKGQPAVLSKIAARVDVLIEGLTQGVVTPGREHELLRVFRYGEKEMHVPPCDGICPLLSRNVSAYVGTFIAYAQVPKSGGAWKFVAADGSSVGFVPQARDAVLFHYKSSAGYRADMLPQLIPCVVAEADEDLLTLTRWLPRATTQAHDEL